ncbi:PDC sensor domain-containing protein [Lentibacter sp.]|uniref:PDC sensor domain-containing protein n=1 Tax=Lentibacter sp. TaxID=2024994 RepID=UPI003F69D0B6
MKTVFLIAAGAYFAVSSALSANEFAEDLNRLAQSTIQGWTTETVVIETLRQQNNETAQLSEDDILALDAKWRAETASGGPLINSLLANDLSSYLKTLVAEGQLVYSEIFITDARGLNAGQSGVTSDYWQGDESKWQVPFGTGAVHIGEVEFDESTQTYQCQVSLPIKEGSQLIGVITVGVDLEHLNAN